MLRILLRTASRRLAAIGVCATAILAVAVPTATADVLGRGGPRHVVDRLTGICESATEIPARLLPDSIDISVCDLRGTLVRAGSLTVRVPHSAGKGANAASIVTGDAPANTVTDLRVLNTGRKVVVDVVRLGEQAGVLPPEASKAATRRIRHTARACTASAHAYTGVRNDDMRWHLDAESIPAYLNRDLAATAIVDGARRLAHGANDCGLGRLAGVQQEYAGVTSRPANCHGPDGQSTVGFGHRPAETLGTACWWYSLVDGEKRIFETDIRFQAGPDMFYNVEPLDCTGRYNLTGVAVHEFGHAFGLAHVNEQRFPYQTMSPVAPTCSYEPATLARGDWLGLRGRYGG